MSLSPELHENSPERNVSSVCINLEERYSTLQELSKAEGMRVFARVRPMLKDETKAGYKECIAAIDDQTVRAIVPTSSAKYKSSNSNLDVIEDFTFTSAFGPETGQFVFFQETMMSTMQNFIEGQNSLVFSYGSTGSGKTFTLQGKPDNPGIIPLSLHLFFASVEDQILEDALAKPEKFSDVVVLNDNEKRREIQLKNQLLSMNDQEEWSNRNSSDKSFAMFLLDSFSDKGELSERKTTLGPEEMAQAQAATLMKDLSKKSADSMSGFCNVWISFVEIYQESVYDLLQPNVNQRTRLNLGEDKNGDVYVKGVQEVCVSNCYEALKLLIIGQKNLIKASTKLNYQSSRSHCIYTIKVVRVPDPENITHAKVNRLSFCDLAGSERAGKAQTTGVRLKEAGCINTSLLVLGRCLDQLRINPSLRDKKLIPFRESKLTRIFSGFFIGRGKAVMIANASPSELTFDETLHVLRFSAIAKELIINDSYIATASSTLQTITNMWTNARNNTYSSDRSISFEESSDETHEEKDEIIEKLLDLAESLRNNLEREKKEKAELEAKIRQDVCQEYSSYSDQLLENQKQTYEAEREALIEIYKNRLASMERRYENIIKDYQAQLEEDSSGDESPSPRKSFEQKKETDMESEMFEDGLSSFVKREDLPIAPESDLNWQKIEALNNDVEVLSDELQLKKEELLDALGKIESLEKVVAEMNDKLESTNQCLQQALSENEELKQQNDFLQKSYQEEIMKLEKEKLAFADETEKKILKEKCDAAVKELEQVLKSKNEMMKEYDALQIDSVFYKTDNKALQKTLSDLQEKVKLLTHNLDSMKVEKCNLECAFGKNEATIKELEELLKKQKVLKTEIDEKLETEKELCSSLKEKVSSYAAEISELESERNNYKMSADSLTEELDALKLKIEDLQGRLDKSEDTKLSLYNTISELNVKLKEKDIQNSLSVEKYASSLKQAEKDGEEAKEALNIAQQSIKDVVSKNEELKHRIEMLETDCDSLQKEVASLTKMKQIRENKIEALEIVCKAQEKKIAEMTQLNQDLENRCSSLLTELENLKNEKLGPNPEESTQLSLLELEVSALKAESVQLKGENDTLKKELSSIAAECVAGAEELTSLKLQLDEARATIHQLEEEKDLLFKKQESAEAENDFLKKLINICQESEFIASEKLKGLHERLIVRIEEIMNLRKMVQGKEADIEKMKKEHSLLNKQCKEFQASIKKQKHDGDELESLKKAKMMLEKEVSDLKDKLTEIQSRNRQFAVDIENLRKDYSAVEQENTDLKSKLGQFVTEEILLTKSNGVVIDFEKTENLPEKALESSEEYKPKSRGKKSTKIVPKKSIRQCKTKKERKILEECEKVEISQKDNKIPEKEILLNGPDRQKINKADKMSIEISVKEKQNQRAKNDFENATVKDRTQNKRPHRRLLKNLQNVPIDELASKEPEDDDIQASKSLKRKTRESSVSSEKLTLKKRKLTNTDLENIPKPQNLRLQILRGSVPSPKPSPRLTRGRRKLFNCDLFENPPVRTSIR